MTQWSGRLAAALRRRSWARMAGAAASLLILALVLTACGPLLSPDSGSRFFAVLSEILDLLPEKIPTSPWEFFVNWAGEDFGEKYADFILSLAAFPNLEVGIFADLFEIAAAFLVTFIAYYFIRYLRTLIAYLDKFDIQQINAGGTDLVPPLQYLYRRMLVTVVVLIPMVKIGPIAMGILGDTAVGLALAMYEDQGLTMAEAIAVLFEMMFQGIQVWAFAFTFIINFVGFLAFLTLMSWRYISIPLFTLRLYWHVPKFMDGREPGNLGEPLERLLHRILVLGLAWFFVLIGPLIALELGKSGFPIAIGLLAAMVLATVAPLILFRWMPGTKGLTHRLVDPLDRFMRTPGVGLTKEEEENFWKRTWRRMPKWARSSGEVGLEVARRDPTYGPAITTIETASQRAKTATPKSVGRDLSEAMYGERAYQSGGGQPYRTSARGTGRSSGQSSLPAMDSLIQAAVSSGLAARKGELSPEVYAMAAGLILAGYAAMTDQELVETATNQLAGITKDEVIAWREMGTELRKFT